MGENDMPDPEKFREILGVVGTEIPKLIDSITKQVFSVDNAEKMSQAVAKFYKQMVDAGMKPEDAFKLTQDFMKNFSLGGMVGQIMGHAPRNKDDIDDVISEKIKEKMKKHLDEED
jgi:hypothetical protein